MHVLSSIEKDTGSLNFEENKGLKKRVLYLLALVIGSFQDDVRLQDFLAWRSLELIFSRIFTSVYMFPRCNGTLLLLPDMFGDGPGLMRTTIKRKLPHSFSLYVLLLSFCDWFPLL